MFVLPAFLNLGITTYMLPILILGDLGNRELEMYGPGDYLIVPPHFCTDFRLDLGHVAQRTLKS